MVESAVSNMQDIGNKVVHYYLALELAQLKQQLIYVAENYQLDLQHPDVLKVSVAIGTLIVQYMREHCVTKRQ